MAKFFSKPTILLASSSHHPCTPFASSSHFNISDASKMGGIGMHRSSPLWIDLMWRMSGLDVEW